MRFSFWPNPSQPFDQVLALAHHVEQSGWDGIWYADHFMPATEETSAPWPEAWITLAALGARVPRLRIGTLVSGNTYRHPAVLAKMAATLDHITGGRVVLGLGSGWQENEHRQYGIPFYSIAERLARLEEACQIIKALYGESRATFHGRYYQLDNATLEPKPRQTPLPLLIGGGGEKVTLRITARYADEWNVWGVVDTLRQKMRILDDHCRAAGRNPAEIQRSAVALLFMHEDPAVVAQLRSKRPDRASLIGTPAEIRDLVQQYQDIGVNELIVPDFTLGRHEDKIRTLDLFINQVADR